MTGIVGAGWCASNPAPANQKIGFPVIVMIGGWELGERDFPTHACDTVISRSGNEIGEWDADRGRRGLWCWD